MPDTSTDGFTRRVLVCDQALPARASSTIARRSKRLYNLAMGVHNMKANQYQVRETAGGEKKK